MTPSQFRLMMEETARRLQSQAQVGPPPDVLGDPDVFKEQREFIQHPANLKALFCPRRSSKSYTAGLYLVHAALNSPGSNCLFIGLTRDSAKAIIWKDILKILDRKHALGGRPNQTELSLTLPNCSVIKVTGVDSDQDEMNKLLGRKYKLVCIDEASMYTIDMRNLVYGVLKPSVVDEGGTICLMGTASNFPRGLFYDITTGSENGWKLFQWTAYDNPHVAKQWKQAIEEIKLHRPLYMQTPQFKQWYLNQWVVDEDKLCYRFSPEKNLMKAALPPQLSHDGWVYVLGVDTGWEDDNAFVLTAYHLHDPHLYVLDSYAQKKMTFDQVAAKIQSYMAGPCPPHKIFIDGANKQGVESMRQRSNIPFEFADKQDKATFIELCNADLVQARIKLLDTPGNRGLWQEMGSLVWVTDGERVKLPKKENPTLANHRCDAFLYAWRNGYHYHWAKLEVKPPLGSKAWYDQQADQIWERERENLTKEDQQGDWPSEGGW